MRDPRLLGSNPPVRSDANQPHVKHHDMAFSSDLRNGTGPSSSHPDRSMPNSLSHGLEQTVPGEMGRLRPRTTRGMNGAYDELYRSQMNGETDTISRDPSPVPQRTKATLPLSLTRARSDLGQRKDAEDSEIDRKANDGAAWKMRHGWEDEHTSSEYLSLLTSVSLMSIWVHQD